MDCVFCKIATGEIPGKILYQDDKVVAFPDIHPAAPTHILIIPRQHIPSLARLSDNDTALVGHMVKIANKLAKEGGIAESGYRVVINCGKEGGQVVPHLHLHLLGGRKLTDGMG
ncbi:MAG: histidine triad nucleotide-binding protein [Dehalococcoidales bacterium]|nr:histidine triad nucleotide-binding protein [Dehalococcoidales bacterium]